MVRPAHASRNFFSSFWRTSRLWPDHSHNSLAGTAAVTPTVTVIPFCPRRLQATRWKSRVQSRWCMLASTRSGSTISTLQTCTKATTGPLDPPPPPNTDTQHRHTPSQGAITCIAGCGRTMRCRRARWRRTSSAKRWLTDRETRSCSTLASRDAMLECSDVSLPPSIAQ